MAKKKEVVQAAVAPPPMKVRKYSGPSNTTVDAGLLGEPIRQDTPAEVLPANWLSYLIDNLPSGRFEDAVERFEEEARNRFKRPGRG